MEQRESIPEVLLLDESTPALVRKRKSQGQIILERFLRNKAASVGAIFLLILVFFCFLGPYLTGHINTDEPGLTVPHAAPSWEYPFGGDDIGRDEFARAMNGGRISILVGLCSMLIAVTIGVAIGAFAGYYGGIVDNILMRVTDTIMCIPLYLLLFVLSASFVSNGSVPGVIFLISALSWTSAARISRGEFLSHKEREYVKAARTIGARDLRIMFRHILPNAAGPIIVNATLLVGNNIILESVLSYFGFGIKIPVASWGSMVQVGIGYYDQNAFLTFLPGLLIFLTVLSCNLVGDGLRDALDPHMTER